MTSVLSKRQQARNEKALQDLVQSVPGNNVCADCHARNPAWASWNLGIFLCMRCAAIHRKLGTHVSKVKSLSMDSWSNEQVDNMRKVGNTASNKVYNPVGQKPPVPIDADEADAAMERFIRQKYVNSAFTKPANHNRHRRTGSSGSDDIPPPLPPKTPGRSGMRSASSIFPLSSKAKRDVSSGTVPARHGGDGGSQYDNGGRPPTSPLPRAMAYPRPESSGSGPGLRSKMSQVFGSSKHSYGGDNVDTKLASLRDMGFSDDRRNTVVLKSVSWDLERAIEILVRMGDAGLGNGRLSPHPLASPRDSSLSAPTRTLTPSTAAFPTSGLSIPTPSSQRAPSSPSVNGSSNPFDALDFASPPAPPQSSQSTGTLQNKNPYNTSNPFGIMPTPQQPETPFNPTVTASASAFNLNQAFQNMALRPPQPLFPHHTGSGVFQQEQQSQLQPQDPYLPLLLQQQQQQQQQVLQAQSPLSIPTAEQGYFSGSPAGMNLQGLSPQHAQYNNPFANSGRIQQQQQQRQQKFSQPLSVNTNPGGSGLLGNNPFTRSPTRIQSPNALGQIPEQSQASYFTALPQSQTYPLPNGNPYNVPFQPLQSPSLQQFLQQSHPQQPQQQVNNPFMTQPPPPRQAPRLHNTASILALYNMQQSTPVATQAGSSTLATAGLHQSPIQPDMQQPLQQSAGGFFNGVSPAGSNPATSAGGTNPFFNITSGISTTSAQQTQHTQYPAAQFSTLPGQRQPPPPPPALSSGAARGGSTADTPTGGRSRDSMMALGMEWSNGRHSPDAFASLSARH